MPRTIRAAHSPDPDDAFMACALHRGAFDDERLCFAVETADVESLNRAARAETYDATALSAAALPAVADRYVVLDHGASFGEGYGPVVVAANEVRDPRKARIACPGPATTAFLALRLAWGDVDAVHAPFDRIPDLVRSGEADLGLLIHEGQVTWQRAGLRLHLDLGEWWRGETGLPLPLGLTVAHRRLADDLAEASRRLRASIEWGLAHRAEALAFARRFGRGIRDDETDRFVSMYVTQLTRDMGGTGRRAVRELVRRGEAAGYLPRAEVQFHE